MPQPPQQDVCPFCNHGQHERCNGMTYRPAGWEVLRVPCTCGNCRPQASAAPTLATA